MPAAVTDRFKKVKGFFSTTLSAQKTSGAASMSLSDATGVPTSTGLVFTVGRVDSGGAATPSTRAIYKGTLSGTTVSNLTLSEGTDQTHAAGTVVEITWTETHWNDAVDGILVEHNQNGTHGAVTADSLTVDGTSTHTGVASFTTHIDVNDSSTAVRDTSDNELVKFAKTASAVNELTITNAAASGLPTLSATGDDTNIGLKLAGKGNGILRLSGLVPDKQVSTTTYNSNLIIQTGWDYITGISTSSNSKAITFPVAFDTILGITLTVNGYSAGNPASITASTSAAAGGVAAYGVTTSGCNVLYYERDAAGTMGTNRYSFSWIAWGIKA